jgi:hypothetical protein
VTQVSDVSVGLMFIFKLKITAIKKIGTFHYLKFVYFNAILDDQVGLIDLGSIR